MRERVGMFTPLDAVVPPQFAARRVAAKASNRAAPSRCKPMPFTTVSARVRCSSVETSKAGHAGRPSRFGLPVAANRVQYAVIVSETMVRGDFPVLVESDYMAGETIPLGEIPGRLGESLLDKSVRDQGAVDSAVLGIRIEIVVSSEPRVGPQLWEPVFSSITLKQEVCFFGLTHDRSWLPNV